MARQHTRVVFTDTCRLLRIPRPRLRSVITRILADHDCTGVLSVAFVDDAAIRLLHRDFLGNDTATDVLSFPLGEEEGDEAMTTAGGGEGVEASPFGEVVVSAETAIREAGRRDISPLAEAARYAIHGTLHLVGYDDRVSGDRRRMRARERHYLDLFGFER